MRITHIITRLIVGGAQESTILTCEELAGRGHEVSLIAGPETGPEGSLWDRARAGEYRLFRMGALRRAVHPARDLWSLFLLRRLLRHLRPQIVHTHSSKAGILGRLAVARRPGIGIVHTIHGMSFNRTQHPVARRIFRGLEAHCGRRTDAVICVARAMAEQAHQAGIVPPERLHVVPSGVDLARFDPDCVSEGERRSVRRSWGVEDGQIAIGKVARLFPNKGYEDLLRVLPEVARRIPQARFVVIGGGPQRAEYERRLYKMGLRDLVHFTGLVVPGDIPRALSGLDILVHLSRWEGLARSLVEAHLMRIPAVSWDLDGAREVVESGVTGRLVPFADDRELVACLADLAEDAELRRRMGETGRDRALERFDHREMALSLEAIYREVLAQEDAR